MLEFAAPETGDVISGKKIFQEGCKECGKANSEKNNCVAVVARGESVQQNLQGKLVTREGHFHKHFSLIMSNNKFWYQPFVAVSGNLVGKVPIVDDVLSSHEQENYPTTSLDKN